MRTDQPSGDGDLRPACLQRVAVDALAAREPRVSTSLPRLEGQPSQPEGLVELDRRPCLIGLIVPQLGALHEGMPERLVGLIQSLERPSAAELLGARTALLAQIQPRRGAP